MGWGGEGGCRWVGGAGLVLACRVGSVQCDHRKERLHRTKWEWALVNQKISWLMYIDFTWDLKVVA